MSGIDGSIAVWVPTHRIGFLNDPSVWLGTIEKLGAVWIVIALLVAAARRVGVARTIAFGVFTGLTTLAADSLSFLLKDATHRTRPFVAHPQIHPLYVVHSSSFPAGHAATAFAGAVLLSAVAPRLTPALVVLATLIAFSRIYDGVHYATDVLAGAVLGAAVGVVAALLLRRFGPAETVRAYA
ncbi:MAG: phosphatase PAP2 family protein [Actinobacteria bacterium]|nr:phosphatase PAP2 family protein [Actinomycetota bacterium]